MSSRFIACFFLILGIKINIFAQKWAQRDSIINAGIEQIYSLKFEEAERTFSYLEKMYPEEPAASFFMAMIEWEKIQLNLEDESRDEIFYKKIDKAIEFCENRLKKNKNDFEAIFFKGGAIGFKGRLLAMREKWVKAANCGKDALPIVYDAVRINSGNKDILFGLGIYNYYVVAIPEKYPYVKPLLFFLPEGNKELGIRQIKTTVEQGKFARYEAAYFLVSILYNFENNFEEAEKYSLFLRSKFPDNPIFQRQLGKIYFKWGKFENAMREFKDIYAKSQMGVYGYFDRFKRDAAYYIGVIYKNYYNQIDSSLHYLQVCENLSLKIEKNNKTKSGYYINCLYYQGEIYESMGFIQTAIKIYNDVENLNNFENSQEKAKRKLKLLKSQNN